MEIIGYPNSLISSGFRKVLIICHYDYRVIKYSQVFIDAYDCLLNSSLWSMEDIQGYFPRKAQQKYYINAVSIFIITCKKVTTIHSHNFLKLIATNVSPGLPNIQFIQCFQIWQLVAINETRRERLKSEPYLRLKKLKLFEIVRGGPFRDIKKIFEKKTKNRNIRILSQSHSAAKLERGDPLGF